MLACLCCLPAQFGLSAIRAFRLVRILSFLRNWKSMSNLLRTVIGSLEDFLHFSCVVVLFIFIFDIAGVQVSRPRIDG